MSETTDTYLTLDLALRVGEVLLSSGAGAADVTATMLSIASTCGLRNCEVDLTFTSLSISYQPGPELPSQTQLRQVRQRVSDYSHLTDVDLLVHALVAGEIDRDEARTRLASIVSSGHRYTTLAVAIGWGFMGMGTSLVIGGDWIVTLIALFATITVNLVRLRMRRMRLPAFYQQVVGGLLATLLAVAVAAARVPVDPSLVITASIIMLLAGVAFMGALQDALTGFYVTGAARTLEALLLTGGIIGGVSGGLAVAHRAGLQIHFTPGSAGWSQLPIVLFGAALTAAAFAFTSYAPVRSLLPIALVGVAGEFAYRSITIEGFSRAWSSAVAAVVIGVVSYALAGRIRVPPLIIVVSTIVPLLPGLSIYTGLFLISEGQTLGLISLATAAAVAMALAAGVIFGEYVAQPLKREAHRLETRLAGPRLVGPFRARAKSRRG
ncbi:MAG: threonine/serine ThrE exporter family protein [Nocardioidaceae bacterium]